MRTKRRISARLPTDRPVTRAEIRRVFEQYVIEYGGIRPAARELGITAPWLQDILEGEKPGPKALDAIGYALIESYQRSKT